jgi:uncharacterized protein YfaS (alpha-2-macroglobulin family)
MAQVAAASHCPFIAGVSPSLMQMGSWQELANPRDLTKLFTTPEYAPWRSLRESEDSRYIGLAMPRFLATADKSQITVSLENISGPAGDYQLAFTAVGGASLGTTTNVKQHLNSGGHAVVRVPLGGDEVGETNIHLVVSGPDSVKFEHSTMLFVRAAQLPVVERTVKRLQPGEGMTLNAAALARFLPSTGQLLASF